MKHPSRNLRLFARDALVGALVSTLAVGPAAPAFANPRGEVVRRGDVTFDRSVTGTLTIRAESRDERESKQGEAVVREIRRGSVNRTVTLPTGLESDKATATFENGVLQLRIPRAEAVKPRQIRITPTVDGNATHATDTAAGEPVAETQEA